MVIDTSRIRVRGTAEIDLGRQTVNLRLIPQPKRPRFLGLATPLEIRGGFSDFRAGLSFGSLEGTIIRFLTAHAILPIQWIVLNRLPADGSDVCGDALPGILSNGDISVPPAGAQP